MPSRARLAFSSLEWSLARSVTDRGVQDVISHLDLCLLGMNKLQVDSWSMLSCLGGSSLRKVHSHEVRCYSGRRD